MGFGSAWLDVRVGRSDHKWCQTVFIKAEAPRPTKRPENGGGRRGGAQIMGYSQRWSWSNNRWNDSLVKNKVGMIHLSCEFAFVKCATLQILWTFWNVGQTRKPWETMEVLQSVAVQPFLHPAAADLWYLLLHWVLQHSLWLGEDATMVRCARLAALAKNLCSHYIIPRFECSKWWQNSHARPDTTPNHTSYTPSVSRCNNPESDHIIFIFF